MCLRHGLTGSGLGLITASGIVCHLLQVLFGVETLKQLHACNYLYSTKFNGQQIILALFAAFRC